jgi:hypothetical protein
VFRYTHLLGALALHAAFFAAELGAFRAAILSALGVWRWVQNIWGHYFTAFYRPEVSMDIENKLSRSVAVTAGIAAAGLAIGAAAMGAFAIGALAIGALAVRKVALRGDRVEKLSVGQLTVDRLLVKDSVNRE